MHSVRTRVSYPYVYSLSLNKDSNANEGNVNLIQYENKPADKLYWYLMTKFIINFHMFHKTSEKLCVLCFCFIGRCCMRKKQILFRESNQPHRQNKCRFACMIIQGIDLEELVLET